MISLAKFKAAPLTKRREYTISIMEEAVKRNTTPGTDSRAVGELILADLRKVFENEEVRN